MLDPLASPRSPGFKWDGSGYASARGQAMDEESLLQHSAALEFLLQVAPTGFPAHRPLTLTFLELDKKHGILGADRPFAQRAASLAADAWRVMAKHIYNVAMDSKAVPSTVRKLVDLIELPGAAPLSRPATKPQ